MLIGIDASRAVSPNPTGTEVYSRELIRALLALDHGNHYRLYTRSTVAPELFSNYQSPTTQPPDHPTTSQTPSAGAVQPPNLQLRSIPFPRLWTHLRLSVEMLTRPPDVLWVPAHVLPPIHPRRSIVTIHDLGHLYFPEAHPALQRAYHTWATRWNARAASHILADSEATRDDIVRFCGVQPGKISVVYPAFDARLFQPVRDPGEIDEVLARFRIDKDYILAIGTIHPRKNYARLVHAFGQLQNVGLKLVIVGKKGWLYDSIFAEINRLNLQSQISILDYVPAVDMPALVSGARLLAFPSLHEGFGLPVLEAQACGTPVVTSMTSSLPEAAGDGALFIDPCDVDALAAAMQRVLRDQPLREKLIANGFRNIERFSWEGSAREVRRIIHDL